MSHPRISAADAHRLMQDEGYLYLDVRTEGEFAQGHPKGAYNIPIKLASAQGMQDNPRFLEIAGAAFDKQQKLVVGCKAGPRSQVAVAALISAGYATVSELGAGYGGRRDAFGRPVEPGWEAAGLPAATASEPGRDYASLARKG
jgi:rhodanese-related sulfurtransferase